MQVFLPDKLKKYLVRMMNFLSWLGGLKRLFSHICQLLVELAIKVTEKGDLAADNRLSSTNCPSHGHMKLKYFDKANMINDVSS